VGDMQRMIDRHDDLLSLDAIEAYFEEVYWRIGEKLDAKRILSNFKFSRFEGQPGTDFAYRTVAEEFRMIESGLAPVIIAFDEVSKKAVHDLGIEAISSGGIAKRLQTYIVQVPPKARDLLIRNGHVVFERPDYRGDQFAVLKSGSFYKPEVGLVWENAEYLAEEQNNF